MSNKRVKEELASLVKIRGSIAHTGQAPGALRLGGARDWRRFVLRLAEKLDPLLEDLVQRRLAKAA